jgi:hypothetical protein
MKNFLIKLIYVFLFFFVSYFVEGQQKGHLVKKGNVTTISLIDSPVEFSGGKDEWYKIIAKNGQVPDSVKNGLIPGGVYIMLKIDTNGNATIQDVRSRCSECKQEAVRLFKLLSKFKPAIENNKKIVSNYNLSIRFKADPDSVITYKDEYLYGTWTIQGEDKVKCPECPSIIFNKDKTAKLISDTIGWTLNNRQLTLKNKNNPTRQQYFLSNSEHKISFTEYFRILIIESGREKYKLYKQ